MATKRIKVKYSFGTFFLQKIEKKTSYEAFDEEGNKLNIEPFKRKESEISLFGWYGIQLIKQKEIDAKKELGTTIDLKRILKIVQQSDTFSACSYAFKVIEKHYMSSLSVEDRLLIGEISDDFNWSTGEHKYSKFLYDSSFNYMKLDLWKKLKVISCGLIACEEMFWKYDNTNYFSKISLFTEQILKNVLNKHTTENMNYKLNF